MDVAADFTMGIWVETVATVGVHVVEFTGAVGVGVVSMGWAITLTLYFSLGEHGPLSLVTQLGFGGFSGHGVVILGRCNGAWLQLGLGLGLCLGLGPGSGTKLTLLF